MFPLSKSKNNDLVKKKNQQLFIITYAIVHSMIQIILGLVILAQRLNENLIFAWSDHSQWKKLKNKVAW